ncbi:MAG: hypothetical protein WC682_03615 [Parcubacteria group bacterium]|jgi:hypothetical protein
MKKNNKFLIKYKIYIIIGILFVIWFCFLFFIIIPSIKSLEGNFDLVQMRLIDMKTNDEKLSKISLLRDNFSKVDSEKGNLDVIFSKDNIVGLVKELEAIAQETGNNVSISVNEDNQEIIEENKNKIDAKENELLKELPTKSYFMIKISLVGDYNSLVKFVNKLNNIKYYNSVVSFNISSKKITIEDKNNKNDISSGGISLMGSGGSSDVTLPEAEKEKLVLSSDLDVIFYSLENDNGK